MSFSDHPPESSRKRKNRRNGDHRNGALSTRERLEASALRIVTLRSHTRAELRKKLRAKKYPGEDIDTLLDRFERNGYIDDGAAARSWVRRRLQARPMGRRAMAAELRGIGVSTEIAEAALAEGYGEGGEAESALRAAEKRLRVLDGKDKLRDRLLRFLMGRGFPAGVCIRAVEDALASACGTGLEAGGTGGETGRETDDFLNTSADFEPFS
ncbi:MAG TPA: regulatory protein RecX [Nitrospinota bacterium]|nr:regulatory protein RecX [Nitrospinota bacterium]HJP15001.1 regulatory protein RecX [Nitrospinota bacterium]